MKKGDYFILFILLIVLVSSFYFINKNSDNSSLTAVIKVDGKLYKEIKLTDDYYNSIEIKTEFGYNKIDVAGKTVKMTESDCDDFLCIGENVIKKPMQSIICLPNRFIVYIKGESEFDYISHW